MLFIREVSSQPDASSGLHDFVVNEIETAFVELDCVVLAVGLYLKCPIGQVLLNLREVGFRQRENHRDRLDLRDHDEAIRVRWMNDVADVDLSYACYTVDRRGELRITELRL